MTRNQRLSYVRILLRVAASLINKAVKGSCPWCKARISDVGDTPPEEIFCDKCTNKTPEQLKKTNPDWFQHVRKIYPDWWKDENFLKN